MQITTGLALPIVSQLMSLLEYNVNIMDDHGVIVASGDPARIGQQHEGALQVLASGEPLVIREQESESFYGSKPGVNLPIEFEGKMVGVVGITGDAEEVYKFGAIIKMNVEALLQQIHMNNQLQYKKMALEGWIADLTNPHEFAEIKLEMTAKSLGIDPGLERRVLLIEIADLRPNVSMTMAMLRQINERKDQLLGEIKALIDYRSLTTYLGEGIFFAAVPSEEGADKAGQAKLVDKLSRVDGLFYVAAGTGGRGLAGYRESYHQAKRCLRLMKTFHQERSIRSIEDWGVIPYLDAIPAEIQRSFLAQYVPSHRALSAEYKSTLKLFFDCELDVKETAARLHIHRNTLFYRLDKISHQLQLDYRKFNDLFIMKLLLIFDQLQQP